MGRASGFRCWKKEAQAGTSIPGEHDLAPARHEAGSDPEQPLLPRRAGRSLRVARSAVGRDGVALRGQRRVERRLERAREGGRGGLDREPERPAPLGGRPDLLRERGRGRDGGGRRRRARGERPERSGGGEEDGEAHSGPHPYRKFSGRP